MSDVPTTDPCQALKDELDKAKATYERMTAPGIRTVRDSDGSYIEYTTGNVEAYRDRLALLQAQYDACIAGRGAALTRPLTFTFP